MSSQPTGEALTDTAETSKRSKFSGLAWAGLILGIVGCVGSPIIFLNNLTAVAAGVGVILGIIALFGTKKIVAGIGVILCILAIVFTVMAQSAAVGELDDLNDMSDAVQAPFEDNTQSETLPVGQTYNGDTMKLKVSNPHSITTGQYAMPEQNAKAIAYDVTVTNTSDKPIDLVMLTIQATVGQSPSEQVYDSQTDLQGTPTTKLLPGKTITFPVAFLNNGSGEVVVQASTLGGETVSFSDNRGQ